MALFSGHKSNCRKRCRAWFSLTPDVERSCRNLCNTGQTEFTKNQFLCQEGYLDEELLILAYGYDPCEGGVEIEEVLDPLDSVGEEDRDLKRYEGVLIVGAALLFVAIVAMVIILK